VLILGSKGQKIKVTWGQSPL